MLDSEEFSAPELIKRGSKGIIYSATQKSDGKKVAVKMFFEKDLKLLDLFASKQLKSPFITDIVEYRQQGSREFKNSIIIVTDFFENGTLRDIISSNNTDYVLNDKISSYMLIWMYGIARGILYLHQNPIIYGDIKPENVLIDNEYYPRISAFGISQNQNEVCISQK